MTSPSPPPLSVFISYSHRDEDLKDELVVHLANLKRQGKIRAWQDRDIEAGAEWDAEIKQQLETAEIILLLITPRFIASDYCYDIEMQRAIARHDAGSARVIPIILKPCDWQGSPFTKLKALPKDGKALTTWGNQDEAFTNVAQGIRHAVEALQAKKPLGETLNSPTVSPSITSTDAIAHPIGTDAINFHGAGTDAINRVPVHTINRVPAHTINRVPADTIFSTYNPKTFTGRDTEIAHLTQILQNGCRLLLIHGMTGIGKTALAERLAANFIQPPTRYSQVILDRGVSSSDFTRGALAILAKLGDDTAQQLPDEQLLPHLLKTLEQQPCWLHLDSLEYLLCQNDQGEFHFADATWLDFLEQFLTRTSASHLILTSQALPTDWGDRAFRLDNLWQEYALRGLDKSQRIDLFRHYGVIPQTDADSDHLCAISDYFDGHPLILKMIAGDIQKRPFNGSVDKYWRDYYQQRQTQTRLKLHQSQEERARQWVRQTLEQLPDLPRQLLQRGAVFRRAVPEDFYPAMLPDIPDAESNTALTFLKSRNLVEDTDLINGELWVQQHNLIREIALAQLKMDTATWETAERQAAHLWLTAYTPAPDAPNLETVRGYLEAFDHYCEVEDWDEASRLYTHQLPSTNQALHWQLLVWGSYKELIELSHKLVDKVSSQTKRLCLNQIGNSYGNLGKVERANKYYQQALEFTRKTDDRQGEGAALGNLGRVYYSLGQYERAIDFYQQYLTIAREIGDRQGEGNALGNLGLAYYRLENYERATDFHQQCLTILREIGDRRGEGNALGNLGIVYNDLGNCERAIDFHQQYLTIAREISDRRGEGVALVNMGATQLKLKQYLDSLTNNQAALEIFREIGDQVNEAEALKNLTEVHQALGEVEVARQFCQQALALTTELGIPLKAECETLMAGLEEKKGEE